MNPLLDAAAVAAHLGISRAAAYREMKNMQQVVIGERTLRVATADAAALVIEGAEGRVDHSNRLGCSVRKQVPADDSERRPPSVGHLGGGPFAGGDVPSHVLAVAPNQVVSRLAEHL